MFAAVTCAALFVQQSADTRPVQLLFKHFPEDGSKTRVSPRTAVSPDGKWLATYEALNQKGTGWNIKFKLWNLTTGKLIQTRDDPAIMYAPKVFVSPDKLAATYSVKPSMGPHSGGTVILSLPDLKPLERFENRYLLAVSPDGATTICRVYDPDRRSAYFELWNWKAKKTIHELDIKPTRHLEQTAFRADGKQVAVAAAWVLDTATGKEVASFVKSLWSLAIAPDGKTVALAGFHVDGPVLVPSQSRVGFWDAQTKRVAFPVRTPVEFVNEAFPGLHYLPDGKHLVLVSTAGVLLWDVAAEKLVDVGTAGAAALEKEAAVSFTPTKNGVYVAAITEAGAVYAWKVTSPPPTKP